MRKPALSGAILLIASVVVVPAAARQDETPSLTTEDVLRTPDSTTNANIAAEEAAAARAEDEAAAKAESGAASAGYTRVVTPSGYSFERPEGWKRVESLESKGAPSFFKYDAIFQDPKSGAVISAVSVDRSALESPIDISDPQSVNQLLSTMLNPANAKDGVKIFRQVPGTAPNGTKWLRIKAQGNGQATDGTVVDTTFWVELIQSDSQLALVAVGYPTAQQDAVGEAAFHTVRTLEMENAPGPAAPAADRDRGAVDAGTTTRKKNSAGGLRQQ
jgi:hypothetical protein